jgi:hypothetical protein
VKILENNPILENDMQDYTLYLGANIILFCFTFLSGMDTTISNTFYMQVTFFGYLMLHAVGAECSPDTN